MEFEASPGYMWSCLRKVKVAVGEDGSVDTMLVQKHEDLNLKTQQPGWNRRILGALGQTASHNQ